VLRPVLRTALLLAALNAGLALGACGVKGPLEPPPEVTAAQTHPGDKGAKPRDTGPVKPDRPFILDGLL
jgi:predicted small lipoprotein YifL